MQMTEAIKTMGKVINKNENENKELKKLHNIALIATDQDTQIVYVELGQLMNKTQKME